MTDDSTAGILCYLTHGKGIQGIFKETAEDFIVEEIPSGLSEDPNGKYLILQVRLRNWETNKFLIYLSRIFGVSRKRISYAGTKDRVGVTTQYFCINTPDNAHEIRLDDVTITRKFRSNHMLRLGDLEGNRFTVNLHTGSDDAINDLNMEMEILGGFPNFFAYQRFGSRRPITHIVGKYILKRDFRSAVMEYLCDPSLDKEDFRKNVYATQDFRTALKEFPQNLMYERAILQHMVETGGFETAFGVLPKNLQIMFVHAYQSYLFNLVLSGKELDDMRKEEKERRIPDYLKDILDCADEIQEFTRGMDWNGFEKDRKTQLVVERLMITIGEASKKILDGHGEFVRNHSEISFKKAYDLRIKLTHGYTSINARTVWGTIQDNLLDFAQKIRNILPDLIKERDISRSKEWNDSGMGY